MSKCPVDHESFEKMRNPLGKPSTCASDTQGAPSTCPVDLNPNNQMPTLSQQKAPGQTLDLPTERTLSTIPKAPAEKSQVWEYPSPQQFFNVSSWETQLLGACSKRMGNARRRNTRDCGYSQFYQ